VTSPRGTRTPVDVVVPVHGGLHHVRACLTSVSATLDVQDHLFVVDDASDPATAAGLRTIVADVARSHAATLLVNERNLGFLGTANRGMRAGANDWLVLLNSDTLVTPGWLDGLAAALTSAPDVAIASPLSNHANLTRIEVPYGTDCVELAAAVARVSPRRYPEIGIATGFCLAAHRAPVAELDFFDPVFGRGYFEEADLCLRAAAAGWRTVGDDATYVHHHGWASFGPAERTHLMAHNAEVFGERWGTAHDRWKRHVRRTRPFAEVERGVRAVLHGRAQTRPRRPLPRSGARWVAESARQAASAGGSSGGHAGAGAGGNAGSGAAGTGRFGTGSGQPTPTHRRRPPRDWTRLARAATAPGSSDRPATSVLWLVPELVTDPIGTSLLAIADRLFQRGIRANIATSGPYDPALLTDPSGVRPFVVSGPDELLDVVPAFDVVVATAPATVHDALLLSERDGARLAGRFELSVAPALAWPDDALALAVAPSLLPCHLGPYGQDLVADWRAVPLGVDHQLFRPADADVDAAADTDTAAHGHAAAGLVVLLHDERAGSATTQIVQAVARELLDQGHEVAVYGDPLPRVEVAVTPRSPATIEADLFRTAGAVVETGPFPGADRVRLRVAASGVPLVTTAALSPASRLHGPAHVAVAPAGDVPSIVGAVRHAVAREQPGDGARVAARLAPRVAAARETAVAVTTDHEVAALIRALGLAPDPLRPVLHDPGHPARSDPADPPTGPEAT
jgi:GT2 family glycosyltransferase